MSIKNMAEKARLILNNQVSYVIFAITAHCNAKCSHCFYWHNIKIAGQRKQLKMPEIEKLSKSLGPLLLLNLCGGEPYLRKELPDIARLFVKNNKAKFITIPSNGYLTETIIPTVERMLTENPDTFFRLGISIDGIGELHDRIRGVDGLFDRLVETIHGLAKLKSKYRNFFLVSSTVFSSDTEDTIRETVDYIRDNLPMDQNAVTYIRGTPKDLRTKKVNLEQYRAIARDVEEKNKVTRHPMSNVIHAMNRLTVERVVLSEHAEEGQRPFNCYSGTKLLVIDDEGEVSPCEILSETFGNLRDHDFDIQKMLSAVAAKDLIQSIKDKKCNCTWECAIHSSMVFNPREYPRIVGKLLTPGRAGSVLRKSA